MHNKFISFLLGFCRLHKAPGFPFIAAAAAGVLQPDTQVCGSRQGWRWAHRGRGGMVNGAMRVNLCLPQRNNR